MVRSPRSAVALILILAMLSSPALAHTIAGDYNWTWCFGGWWSEPYASQIEAGMDDAYASSSYNQCKASRVEVRLKDDIFYTVVDEDVLMPLFAEVDTGYVYISYSKHMSKEPDGTWYTKTIYHSHY